MRGLTFFSSIKSSETAVKRKKDIQPFIFKALKDRVDEMFPVILKAVFKKSSEVLMKMFHKGAIRREKKQLIAQSQASLLTFYWCSKIW